MNSLSDFIYLLLPIAAFAVAIGGFIWLVVYLGGKDKKQPPTFTTLSGPNETAPADEQGELLCVSRTENGLVIYVQGERHRRLEEITDPQVGRDTVEAIKAVLEFSANWLPSMRQQVTPPSTAPGSTIDQETFLSQLRQAPPPPPAKPPGLLAPLQRRTPSTLLDPLPLVEEIDELVQRKLHEQPELAEHRIRLTSGATGGLCIYVGDRAFDAVGDVTDPRIKALIQEAIREWEEGR